MSQVANSRHGLVPCPRCQVHIKAEDLQSGCPFCPTSTTSSKQRLRRLGLNSRWAKGALVAASILGLSAGLAACAPAVALYGVPPGESAVEQPADTGSQATDGGSNDAGQTDQ